MTSFQFCLPVSDVSEFILRFFLSQQQSTFLFLKIFLVADALARAGLGPGAAAPRPGGDPLQFLCISMFFFQLQ